MALETVWADIILDAALEVSGLYVGLLTSGDVELSGNGYARVSVAASTWDAASGGAKDNGAAISFPEATDTWSEAAKVGLYSAVSGGSKYASYDLTAPITATAGQVIRFPAGDFVWTAA